MHRAPFVKICEEYVQDAASADRAVAKELISHVLATPRCFDRVKTAGARDIAAYTLILSPERDRVLFIDHAKIGLWTQPGGHADGNTDIHAVAREEVLEEVGLTDLSFLSDVPFHIHRFDYDAHVYGYAKSIYTLFFSATFPANQVPRVMEPDKCNGIRWFSRDDIATMITADGDPYSINQTFLDKWTRLTCKTKTA